MIAFARDFEDVEEPPLRVFSQFVVKIDITHVDPDCNLCFGKGYIAGKSDNGLSMIGDCPCKLRSTPPDA